MFTLEDGTGTVAGANAYVAVATVDAYFADRANVNWDGADSEKEVAIIKATDHVDRRWGLAFKGYRLVSDQPLEFPRAALYDGRGTLVEGIPVKLENACAEYAVRILSGENLSPDPEIDDSGQAIEEELLQVGPIKIDTKVSSATATLLKSFPDADRLLLEYMSTGRQAIRA